MKTLDRKWAIFSIGIFTILFGASVLAYLHGIPGSIKKIPYYDSIGHFILFGSLAFALEQVFQRRNIHVFGASLSKGSLIVAIYAVIDESLQLFSANRTFSLEDLSFSLLGVCVFTLLSSLVMKNKAKNSQHVVKP